MQLHFYGALKGPFNEADREKGGMGREWYEELSGRGWAAARGVGEGQAGIGGALKGEEVAVLASGVGEMRL